MSHADVVAAVAGVLVTIASIVLGAWLDLRSRPGDGESRAESCGEGLRAESRGEGLRADRSASARDAGPRGPLGSSRTARV